VPQIEREGRGGGGLQNIMWRIVLVGGASVESQGKDGFGRKQGKK